MSRAAPRSFPMSKLFPAAIVAALATVTEIAFIATVPTPAHAAETVGAQATATASIGTEQARAIAGKPLFDAKGQRIGAIYAVAGNGAAQLIVNGKMVSVPAATLAQADGKLVTSLTRAEPFAALRVDQSARRRFGLVEEFGELGLRGARTAGDHGAHRPLRTSDPVRRDPLVEIAAQQPGEQRQPQPDVPHELASRFD